MSHRLTGDHVLVEDEEASELAFKYVRSVLRRGLPMNEADEHYELFRQAMLTPGVRPCGVCFRLYGWHMKGVVA